MADTYSYYATPLSIVTPDRGSTVPDPGRPYVPAARDYYAGKLLRPLGHSFDEVTDRFGPETYKKMLTDPAVGSSYRSLQLSVVDARIDLAPRVKPPVSYRPGDGDSEGLDPEQKLSQDVLAFSKRNFDRLEAVLPEVRLQLAAYMGFGVKLGEFEFDTEPGGEDAGKWVWSGLRVKPNWSWRFVVDHTLKVLRLITWDVSSSQYVLLDVTSPEGRAKFNWLSWMPEDGDPRGTSILRAAYNCWNLKVQMWPLYYQHLCRFASPGLKGKLAPNDVTSKPAIDAEGNPVAGAVMTPTQHMAMLLHIYRGSGVIVTPDGAEVDVIEPKTAGEAFTAAFDLFDRQITRAIELQVQTSMESKFGSKAQSETGQDTKGLVTSYGRDQEAGFWQRSLKALVEVNYGKDVADRHTPIVSPGKAEQQDKSRIWGAVASLVSSGYVGESQKPELDAEIGLPPRDAEADAEAAAALAKQQADLQAKVKTAGSPAGQKPDSTPSTVSKKGKETE